MVEGYKRQELYQSGGDAVRDAFHNQMLYCRANDAPVTARIVAALLAALDDAHGNPFLERVRDWPGAPLADALPLRAAGGLHALHLRGDEPGLSAIYRGAPADDIAVVRDAIDRRVFDLLPWLDGPPQTNEAGRSANFIAALLWLAEQGLPARFECLEIGSSAGINLMIDRYRYELAGVSVGPEPGAMRFEPEWRGDPPPDRPIELDSLKGCDVAPVDLTDPAQALRLKAYIWPEHTVRFARMDAAIAAAGERAPDLVAMNAAEFVETELARPQAAGTTRVLMHSIVWQYVPADQQARVSAAMEAAGTRATAERPLAWISLEANRTVHHHELGVRYWPGGEARVQLGTAHAHGAWLEWFGEPRPSAWPDG
ncbi:MAG TPA: DUF2332 domain-containing protein [Novosphingobium sp.]|nr:DUF2332 domain-containing protein [Novosphingobium sp.]